MKYTTTPPHPESLRLECVTTCVGFDDVLDVTLRENHAHLDTMIVVTSHEDKKTQGVAKKHGAICVVTDLFSKNGRKFNKGAALNAGMGRWQYMGWRLILDADMILPDSYRRMIMNHTHLDENCIYGADRVDVVGLDELAAIRAGGVQHRHGFLINAGGKRSPSGRYVDTLRGYVPIGCHQLYHSSQEKPYPWSLGTAAHDDVLFAEQWRREHRRMLPTAMCYHLCPEEPRMSQNWEGRKSKRLDTKS